MRRPEKRKETSRPFAPAALHCNELTCTPAAAARRKREKALTDRIFFWSAPGLSISLHAKGGERRNETVGTLGTGDPRRRQAHIFHLADLNVIGQKARAVQLSSPSELMLWPVRWLTDAVDKLTQIRRFHDRQLIEAPQKKNEKSCVICDDFVHYHLIWMCPRAYFWRGKLLIGKPNQTLLTGLSAATPESNSGASRMYFVWLLRVPSTPPSKRRPVFPFKRRSLIAINKVSDRL